MIVVYGASDDLIEVEGDIEEEFSYHDNEDDDGNLLAFSDGTVLRIVYDSDGVWRITPVAVGQATVTITQAVAGDEDKYSDIASIEGDVKWVTQGVALAKSKA